MRLEPFHLAQFAPGRPFHADLVTIDPSSRSVSPHTHVDFYEIFCVIAGVGAHVVDGRESPLAVGDVVLVRPWDSHEFSTHEPAGLQIVNVAFAVGLWRSFLDLTGVRAVTGWDGAAVPVRGAAGGRADEVAAEARAAVEAFRRGGAVLDLMRFLSVVTGVLVDETATDGAGAGPSWLRHACAALTDEEGLRLGLTRMIDVGGVSRGHLSRVMRARHGCTAVQFLTERRLVHGATLLGTTSDPVESIARRCGFDGASYFGRLFRRRFGMSPRDYRSAARSGPLGIG